MSFSLTKQEAAQRAALESKLTERREALDAKLEALNEALQSAVGELEDEVASYNEALEEARGFVGDIVNQAEEDFGDKSERWAEGERGEAVREWINEWEGAALDDVELPEIEPLAIDDDGHAGVLGELPDEPAF